MTCTDGIYVGERRIDNGDCSGPKSARCVLMTPTVEAAVFETARGGILREGLAFDYCDVAVVTNIGDGDHLGISEVNTIEDLAKVKRCIVDVVSPKGYAVLNAADPLVVEMAPKCPGNVLFFAMDGNNQVIVRHRGVGGRAVFVRDGQIIFAEGNREEILMPVDAVPLTVGGKISFHVENTLASVAAAWCLGISLDIIRSAGFHDRGRHGQGARPVQYPGYRRRHGYRGLRPQRAFLDCGAGSGGKIPAKAPHGRLLHGRRSPRLRHDPPGRIAGRTPSTA